MELKIGDRVKVINCPDASWNGIIGTITAQDGQFWMVQPDEREVKLPFFPRELEIVEQPQVA